MNNYQCRILALFFSIRSDNYDANGLQERRIRSHIQKIACVPIATAPPKNRIWSYPFGDQDKLLLFPL